MSGSRCAPVAVALLMLVPIQTVGADVSAEIVLPQSNLVPVAPALPEGIAVTQNHVAASVCGSGYLLAWDSVDGVHAARVTRQGDVLDTLPLRIAERGFWPSVASNGSTCLVAWYTDSCCDDEMGHGTARVLGVRLGLDGEVLDPAPVELAAMVGNVNPWPVPVWIVSPQVASDGSGYVVSFFQTGYWPQVAWRFLSDELQPIGTGGWYTQPYFACGVGVQPPGGPNWSWTFASSGSQYLLARAQSDAGSPPPGLAGRFESAFSSYTRNVCAPVAAASDGSGYLVAFQRPEEPAGLWAALVAGPDPRQYDPSNTLHLDEALGSCADAGCRGTPLVSWDGKAYLVAWYSDGAAGVIGSLVGPAGELLVPPAPLFSTPPYASPTLVSGGDGTSLLAYAARDPTSGERDVRARVIVTDLTPPAITVPSALDVTATRSDGALVTWAASATDDHAGSIAPVCAPASGSLFPPGTTTVRCVATDPAGNVGSAAFEARVTFAWSGFRQPIKADGSSVFKAGRDVPVRFRLTGASSGITDLAARLRVSKVATTFLGSLWQRVAAQTAADGFPFRYDAASGQYVAKVRLPAGRWALRADLGDGVERVVQVTARP